RFSTGTMSDNEPATKPPPKVFHRGRTATPVANSNADKKEVPEFEPFGLMPRGPPPLIEFLDIWEVDMLQTQSGVNKPQHNTHVYANDRLIVRRGQEFQLKVTFDRAYKPSEDQFAVEFVIGASPQFNKGTYIPVFVNKERQSPWPGRVVDSTDNVVTLGITPAPDCIVGKWRVYLAVMTPYGIRRTKWDETRDVYILFNPWAPADSVFLDDYNERLECVLNELGVIYHGAFDDVAERPWNFGQFDYGVLDACLFILDKASMPITNRGDPIKVTRIASAMLNSRDDDGVLEGNWGGDYTYGVAPTSWTGSSEILLQYSSSKRPVCYAQCWVYAAVFNTFLRCLGIPGRVVTNFFSAHDNNGNLRTDIILDDNGKIDRLRTVDTIWNYHCWNECYMTRPDLPPGFGGWQVVDATPQETSDGMYRCGPASVHAIKHGQLCYQFDAPFVFAEVNSDVVFKSRNRDGTLSTVKVNTSHVGRMVLTKAQGQDTRRDITDHYKFSEGSPEERTVLEKAEEYGSEREKASPPKGDVELVMPLVEVRVGDSFELKLVLDNASDQARSVDMYVSGNVVYYTGVTSSEFLFKSPEMTLGPKKAGKEVVIPVPSKDYMRQLVEQANLHFIATGKVKETGQIISAMRVVTLHTPKLSVEVSGQAKVGEKMLAIIKFTNPFKFNLEDVNVRVEGPGVMSPKHKHYSLVTPGSSLTWTEHFHPRRAGPTKLMASLDCAALRQVYGQVELAVEP
uniref:protein-glutamine gamma-glutamyltransferase n=2 Tax=Esox lucius TaxID=8010 RepID=A0A3P8XEH1_ESOLU